MNKEIWKKIPFNLDYEVSNLGRIRHLTKTIYDINNGGYKTAGGYIWEYQERK